MNLYIQHPQDLHDAINQLKEVKLPFFLITTRGKPKEGDEFILWKRVNSFFHRGIVPTYCYFTGLLEPEAKEELQRMFATVEEHTDHFIVESIGGMNLPRLNEFVEQCQTHIIKHFGERANDLIELHRKTKIIKK